MRTIVYCEDNRCQYWQRGRCTAKVLLLRFIAPPADTECEDCQWCVAFGSLKEYKKVRKIRDVREWKERLREIFPMT